MKAREQVSMDNWRLRIVRGTHVADTAVDVAFFFEAKEPGAAGGIAENEALSHKELLASGVFLRKIHDYN